MNGRLAALAFGAVVTAISSATPAGAISTANEVCAPAVDPCIVSKAYLIDNGATLDFGSRAVQIQGAGQFDTGVGAATIKCGKFSAINGTNIALKVRGPSGGGTVDGGNLVIEVARRCSARQTTSCIRDSECNFGTCSSQVCQLDADRLCVNDDSCDLGACGPTVCSRDIDRLCSDNAACDVGPCNLTTRRCSQDATVVCFSNAQCSFGPCALDQPRCTEDLTTVCATNTDCNLGSCSVDVCSTKDSGAFRQCSIDGDCFDGTCSIGDGSVTLNGRSRADGITPGSISIRAAGNINVLQTINVSANSSQSDGGRLELESGTGSVSVNANIDAYGGGQSQGGEICLIAGDDITVSAQLNANGGDFDGGFVELIAGDALSINSGVLARATNGAGLGGEISASADGNIVIGALAQLLTGGSQSADGFGGDGGPQSFYAGGNLAFNAGAKIEADGAPPDGFGEDVYFESGGTMSLAGSVSTRGRGTQGAGGSVSTDAGGTLDTTAASTFTVTGGNSGGGSIDWYASGSITHAGTIDGRASNNGSPDSVLMFSETDVTITGSVLLNGGPTGAASGDIEIEGCRVNVNSPGLLSNLGGNGTTTLIGRERITVNPGGSVLNASNGTNTFRYRAAEKPPIVLGTVTPAFVGDVEPSLSGCPICGNNELEGGETCDDGNLVGGDGCSANCQDEGCIAGTPGYPDVPLCDDGRECTIDICDTSTSSCVHELSCEDDNECTIDTCVSEECVHEKNASLCDDDNECTLDICGTFGCTYALASGPCDDGLACTINDQCSAGLCQGTDTCPTGQFCSENTGSCETEGGGCGDPNQDGRKTASDALFVLNVAVGLQTCALCTCDVDSSSSISASDALRLLNFSVGLPVPLSCPAC
jgi:cysteine-rich repeat protein